MYLHVRLSMCVYVHVLSTHDHDQYIVFENSMPIQAIIVHM